MKTFEGEYSRKWEVRIDVNAAKKARGSLKVDLLGLFDNGAKAFAELLDDPILFVDVLWLLVEKQAKELKVTAEAFAAEIKGDVLGDAIDAFTEELVDFFPGAERRKAMRAMLAAGQRMQKARMEEAAAEAAGLGASGDSSTSPPVPSASIPAPSTSAS